jgi:hypothetical protein
MPQWVQFKELDNSSASAFIFENAITGDLVAAYDYAEAVLLTGAPFYTNVLVGVDLSIHAIPEYNSNIYQTMQYAARRRLYRIPRDCLHLHFQEQPHT